MFRIASLQKFCLLLAFSVLGNVSCSSYHSSADCYHGPRARLDAGYALAPPNAPAAVHRAIAAGNAIQNAPYQYGGGHGKPCTGLDCSGSVSYVLRSAGLIKGCMASKEFRSYGDNGAGDWISIYAKNGHVFMSVCNLRLDTSNGGRGDTGPRWSTVPRKLKGFRVRHPSGL